MLGRGEDEDHMRRRLFQSLQQRVERLGGEVVYLVDDVDLVTGLSRRVLDVFDDLFAQIVDTGLRRGVHLDDVHADAVADAHTQPAYAARLGRRAILRDAVERAGQEPGRGGLAAPARAVEQVGVRDPARPD